MEFGPNPFYGINIKTLNIPCSTLTPEEITEIFGDSVTVNYKHDIKCSASGLAISFAGVAVSAAAVLLAKKRNK